MGCNMDTDYLQDYLDGALSPVEKMIVDEHLKTCECCRNELKELKLLFWELQALKDEEIEIPPEAAAVRNKVINKYVCTNASKGYGIKQYFSTQKCVFQGAGIFMDFIPGMRSGKKIVQKSIKTTPSLLTKALGSALTGGAKLMLARTRA